MLKLAVVLFLVAHGVVAAPPRVSLGMGSEISISTTDFTGTYSGTTSTTTSRGQIAARAFVDLVYGELSMGYSLLTASTEPTVGTSDVHFYAVSLMDFSVGAMVKLPFTVGSIVLYPFVGLDYAANVMYVDDKGSDLRSSVSPDGLLRRGGPWISAGVGIDVLTYDILHLRIEAAYCFNPIQTGAALDAVSTLGTLSLSPPRQGIAIRLLSSWTIN